MRALLLTVLLLPAAAAQTPGTCTPGTATALLDAADVRATLSTAPYRQTFGPVVATAPAGSTYNDPVAPGYEVPWGSGRSPLFALAPAFGGREGGGVRVAGSREYGPELWPGPLGADAALPPDGCAPYDRIWAVSQTDLAVLAATGVATRDLAEWPVGLGAPAVDASGQPVVTGDRARRIDLAAGERPVVSGRQVAFWVLNDVGNVHQRTGSDPLGIEVQMLAVVPDAPALARATVYRARIVNRSTVPIADLRTLVLADFDLGNAVDDYAGSDSTRRMAFTYNADEADDGGGGYGVPSAVGVDLLSGAESAPVVYKNGQNGLGEPTSAAEFWCRMQGLLGGCTPAREGGFGNGTMGPVTRWAFPGDPVARAFWSMENTDGMGGRATPQDQRSAIATSGRTLAPRASVDVVYAILFAQGADRFDSVARLRAVSDAAQAAFDAGTLLAAGSPAAPAAVPAPVPVSPAEGALVANAPVDLVWEAVPAATRYRVEISSDAAFVPAATTVRDVRATTAPGLRFRTDGTVGTFYWRVRSYGPDAVGPFSAPRSYRNGFDYTAIEFLGQGVGIVETARPGGGVCTGDAGDVGCQRYGGNTVWRNPDVSGDYYVSALVPDYLFLAGKYLGTLYPGRAVEMRFTSAGGVAVDYATNRILRVPFEAWFLGDDAGPADDVRMIPLLGTNGQALPATNDWQDYFPGVDGPIVLYGEFHPKTLPVYLMQPKPGGSYAAFAEDALAFGGPGAVYDPALDRDTEVGGDPTTGGACANQGFYVDFCYRNDHVQYFPDETFVAPVNDIVFVDLARDGTTPPAGTTVRFQVSSPRSVDAAAVPPDALAGLGLPYPNPSRGASVRVPFETKASGRVRVAVLDLLGRTVAVLADDVFAPGAHEARLPAGLAPGVYVVVLDVAGAPRATRRLTVVR